MASYVRVMKTERLSLVLAAALTAFAAGPLYAQTFNDPYSIIRPEPNIGQQPQLEPWLAPKYQSPRGERLKRAPQGLTPPPLSRAQVPPPIYVPETGRLLPNLPSVPGAGPGGRETSQDRAIRCSTQAGAYGPSVTGNPNAYLGACVTQ